MARILGFQYGEMRGKLGGNVFSRNKAGAYVRAKITPVNPQSVRQQNQRYRFGNMSILYQSLSTMAKDCWQTFAGTHFNPLKGNNTGIYSGGNAFVAVRQSASQGNSYRVTPTVANGAGAVTVTASPYNEAVEPPNAPTSSTVKSIENNVWQLALNSIQLGEDGTYQIGLNFPGSTSASTDTFSSLTNAEQQNFGLGLYISNNLKFEGSKPNTALKLNYIDTGVLTNLEKTGSAPLDIKNGITLSGNAGIDPADIRDFPCVDDWVLATVFVRSIDGSQKLMGTKYVKYTATVS